MACSEAMSAPMQRAIAVAIEAWVPCAGRCSLDLVTVHFRQMVPSCARSRNGVSDCDEKKGGVRVGKAWEEGRRGVCVYVWTVIYKYIQRLIMFIREEKKEKEKIHRCNKTSERL